MFFFLYSFKYFWWRNNIDIYIHGKYLSYIHTKNLKYLKLKLFKFLFYHSYIVHVVHLQLRLIVIQVTKFLWKIILKLNHNHTNRFNQVGREIKINRFPNKQLSSINFFFRTTAFFFRWTRLKSFFWFRIFSIINCV